MGRPRTPSSTTPTPSWWSWPGRSCSRWPSGSTSQPASPRGDVLVRGGHGRGVRHHGRRRRPRGARRPLRAVDHGVRTGRGHRVRRWAPGRGDTLDPHQRHHGASCSPGAPSWGSWPGARRPATGPPWLLRGYRSAAAIFLVGFATLDTLSPPPGTPPSPLLLERERPDATARSLGRRLAGLPARDGRARGRGGDHGARHLRPDCRRRAHEHGSRVATGSVATCPP